MPPWLCSLDAPGATLCEYRWKQVFFSWFFFFFSIFQNTAQPYLERLKMLNFCTHNFLFPIRKKVYWQLGFQCFILLNIPSLVLIAALKISLHAVIKHYLSTPCTQQRLAPKNGPNSFLKEDVFSTMNI